MHAAIWGLTARWSSKSGSGGGGSSSSGSGSDDDSCGVILELLSRGALVDVPDGDGCRFNPLYYNRFIVVSSPVAALWSWQSLLLRVCRPCCSPSYAVLQQHQLNQHRHQRRRQHHHRHHHHSQSRVVDHPATPYCMPLTPSEFELHQPCENHLHRILPTCH